MSNRELRLQTAINNLAEYFGINKIDDLIRSALRTADTRRSLTSVTSDRDSTLSSALRTTEEIARRPNSGDDIQRITQAVNQRFLAPEIEALGRHPSIDPRQGTLIKNVIDTSNGAYLTKDLIHELNNLLAGVADVNQRKQFFSLFEIYYGKPAENSDQYYGLMDLLNGEQRRYRAIVGTTGNDGDGILQEDNVINSSITEPNRTNSPAIAVYVSKHPRISLNLRNANACTIFFNGMPSYELSRAVPFIEITMFYPRPALSSDGRLFATSIAKFLDGAKTTEPLDPTNPAYANPAYVMAKANEMAGTDVSRFPQIETYTKAGMELFLSPQTLVNADEIDDENLRANPVLDKFRPFLSVMSFDVEVRPSFGDMCTKTAKLKLRLHDRSRMNDIADLLKADLYSSQEIDIEYGWSHPDNNIVANVDNDYADLINGMRVKERYGVMGSTFTFLEAGTGVDIELQLFTRGAAETMTQLIFNYSSETQNYMRTMREIQQTIARLRNRIYPAPEENQRVREVRAPQILEAAVDANATFRFTAEQLTQLRNLRTNLSNHTGGNSDVRQLSEQLNLIFGTATRRQAGAPQDGQIRDLRQSIITNARNQLMSLRNLNGEQDPFYRSGESNKNGGLNPGVRNVQQPDRQADRQRLRDYHQQLGTSTLVENSFCSFATLMLHMVGKPLAATHRFDEIQFLYYPFNNKAGYANGLTTANFLIDLRHFEEQIVRNRLENVNSSAAMTIREFIRFMQNNFFDDQSSYSYGLWGQNGQSLVREAIDRTTGAPTVAPAEELPQYQTQLHQILMNRTPNGDFQLPQVEVLLECIPSKIPRRESTGSTDYDYGDKNILRIHVFDASATAFSSEASILNAAREDQLGILNTVLPSAAPSAGNTTEVNENTRQAYQQALQAAIDFGIIEVRGNDGITITDRNTARQAIIENTGNIRVLGGSRKLKEFLFKTAPHIIYGANGSTVLSVQASSQPDATLQTIQLQRSPSQSSLLPSGEQPGGLPMQVIPSQVNLTTFGNPLVSYMQNFFLDLQTGTTLDNIYYVTGLSHNIEPGKFTTQIQFSANDAYQQYNNLNSRIANMISVVNQAAAAQGTEAPGTATTPTPPVATSATSTGTPSPQAPTG